MKALSIKQPWASLIAHGIKDIENRAWRTNFRGKIYIHVSAKKSGTINELLTFEQKKQWANYLVESKLRPEAIYSAIIGEVEIIDCVINHSSIWAEKTEVIGKTIENEPLYQGKPIWNWVLANPVLYKKPILNVKGKLSFWEPTPNQECLICGEMYFGPEPVYCCRTASADCGCLGMPVYPSICSKECGEMIMSK